MNSTVDQTDELPLIVRLFLDSGLLEQKDQVVIREAQSKDNLPVEEVLIRKRLAKEGDIAQAYADHFLVPLYEPGEEGIAVDSDLARHLPEKLCRDHQMAPVAVDGNELKVAFFTPSELHIVDELQLLTGMAISPMVAPLSVIEGLLAVFYDDSAWPTAGGADGSADFEEVGDDQDDAEEEIATEEIVHIDRAAPPGRDGHIIRYVNQVFEQALRIGASDIHIERYENNCRVRLRIDGKLNEIVPPSTSLYGAVIARIKVLSKMDIAEKRKPQDGAIALKSGEKRVDMRVNTVPTVYGEKVVMRVLDRNSIPLQLTDLGLTEQQSTDLTESIQMPHGLMLVTGPTGSGKSTTLYACLSLLNKPQENICTVEDPVEYKFAGINQIQVKNQVGLTFASALRAFMRQDPDVIMVGEVRDGETAEICLRAALTGHFVLSTLHTNDSLAAVNRLQDMGIEPFLLASTLRVIVAQRLVRRLCPKCREPYQCDAETAERLGFDAEQVLYKPGGCRECRDTGYRGRVGVYEVVRITSKMGELIQKQTPLPELRRAAAEQGFNLLRDSALERVCDGSTALENALTITVAEEE
ncbi:MAG: Flp pilus assembly complex ATPase component TadA [Planctomycetes bacterium]|nr:Flp pilus assembly complex ATPase component TadA [Planctomycetota bacterium]